MNRAGSAVFMQGFGNTHQAASYYGYYGTQTFSFIQGTFNESFAAGVFIQGYNNVAREDAHRSFMHGAFCDATMEDQKVFGANRGLNAGFVASAQVTFAAPRWLETTDATTTPVREIAVARDRGLMIRAIDLIAVNTDTPGNMAIFRLATPVLALRQHVGPDAGTGFAITASTIKRNDGGDWSSELVNGDKVYIRNAAATHVVGPDGANGFIFGNDTITRATGDWTTERGFGIGAYIRLQGSEPFNLVTDVVNGFDISSTTNKITRLDGNSWLDERGFGLGDVIRTKWAPFGFASRTILSVTATELEVSSPLGFPLPDRTADTSVQLRGATNANIEYGPVTNASALVLTIAGANFIENTVNNPEDTTVYFEGDTIDEGFYEISNVGAGVDGTLTFVGTPFVPNTADNDIIFDLPARLPGGSVSLTKIQQVGVDAITASLDAGVDDKLLINVTGLGGTEYQWLSDFSMLECAKKD